MSLPFLKTGVAFAVASISLASGAFVQTPSGVDQLAWMAGDWQCTLADGSAFQEIWLPPVGGTMQGMGRQIKGGKVVFMEFLSIEPDKEGKPIMYIMLGAPSRGDKKPRQFKMTSSAGEKAVFEWPENDFPSKIEYARRSPSNLYCQISGKPGGKETVEVYDFKTRK